MRCTIARDSPSPSPPRTSHARVHGPLRRHTFFLLIFFLLRLVGDHHVIVTLLEAGSDVDSAGEESLCGRVLMQVAFISFAATCPLSPSGPRYRTGNNRTRVGVPSRTFVGSRRNSAVASRAIALFMLFLRRNGLGTSTNEQAAILCMRRPLLLRFDFDLAYAWGGGAERKREESWSKNLHAAAS